MKLHLNKKIQLTTLRTKVLFIYRDGTLVEETPINYIVDKVFFYPGAIFALVRIATELYSSFILVNNQVGLNTESFPRVLFYDSNKFFLRSFEGESLYLSSVYIAPSKKTSNNRIGMLYSYFSKTYDSIILSSMEKEGWGKDLSLNKLNGGITVCLQVLHSFSWKKKYKLLKFCFSECLYRRGGKETDIQIFLKIEGKGISFIHTGYGFFDHMLDQICIHTKIDLVIKVKGDLHVGEHHSIEDTATSLGVALSKTLKDKRGIARYGFLLPMDDALAQVALDLGGRSNLIWKAYFAREKIGDVSTEMFTHFFKSFSDVAYCNLHITAEGNNEHHKIEAIFKAFAYALKIAISRNYHNDRSPSTKVIL